jgi:uncharacterized Fe-S radical SAM superfamily protein PflX
MLTNIFKSYLGMFRESKYTELHREMTQKPYLKLIVILKQFTNLI